VADELLRRGNSSSVRDRAGAGCHFASAGRDRSRFAGRDRARERFAALHHTAARADRDLRRHPILPAPFLDIRSLVLCCGERGLLSVAFHPNYSQNGFFFVYYTDLTGDINIARYKVGADPNVADPNSALILKTISHRDFANHNGGQLAFGPDGYLYAGTGDGGSGGDPNNNGQNLQALLG